MSIKEALIEELAGVLSSVVPSTIAHLAISEIVDKHLKGYTIVPEEITDEQVRIFKKTFHNNRGEIYDDALKSALNSALTAAKEQQ